MAFINTVPLQEFSGVAAGNTATLRVPTGHTWHKFLLTYSGVTLAQMQNIRLKVNGKVIAQWADGTVLDKYNQFDGRAAASGAIYIDLERYGLLERAMKERTALGTGVKYPGDARPANDPVEVTSIYLEIDIDAAATAPAFTCKGWRSAPSPTGPVKKLRRHHRNATGAGDLQITDLPKGEPWSKLYINSSVVTAVKLEVNGVPVYERTAAENNQEQTDGERVPQSNLFVIDPSELGYGDQAIPTGTGVNEIMLTLTCSGAGNNQIDLETISFLEF